MSRYPGRLQRSHAANLHSRASISHGAHPAIEPRLKSVTIMNKVMNRWFDGESSTFDKAQRGRHSSDASLPRGVSQSRSYQELMHADKDRFLPSVRPHMKQNIDIGWSTSLQDLAPRISSFTASRRETLEPPNFAFPTRRLDTCTPLSSSAQGGNERRASTASSISGGLLRSAAMSSAGPATPTAQPQRDRSSFCASYFTLPPKSYVIGNHHASPTTWGQNSGGVVGLGGENRRLGDTWRPKGLH